MPKLTKKIIDSAQPITNKTFYVWDQEIKGFSCQILPSGRKTYYYIYRNAQKKWQRLKIGVHGSITCELARGIAQGWAGDLARGTDPKEYKKKQEEDRNKSVSFEEFWKIFTERYIQERHKASTIKGDHHRVKNHILPFFRSKKIADIDQKSILDFKDSLSHIKGNCNKCLSLLSTAFNQAELWGYRAKKSNPCEGVVKHPEKKMERFLTNDELKKLEKTIEIQKVASNSSPYTLAALWMLLYTGCREGEVLTLKWKDVHLDDGYLYLKDSKVGVRTIPLNDKAKQILMSLQKQENNPYVFCGRIVGQHLKETKTTWRKTRTLAGIPDFRIHDLRHSFASFALKKGIDLYTVSKLLGHKNIATTTRYAHLELEHLKKATNIVAEVFK